MASKIADRDAKQERHRRKVASVRTARDDEALRPQPIVDRWPNANAGVAPCQPQGDIGAQDRIDADARVVLAEALAAHGRHTGSGLPPRPEAPPPSPDLARRAEHA